MDDNPGNQAIDFVLPHPNITYTPCGRNHTYHPEDWPLTGTISIDKCERQCRFRACKAWSQSAAALRKHVNAHIANNKLDLTVLSASNGREPLKISVSDDPLMPGGAAHGSFHQAPSLKPMPYSSFDSSPLPSGIESDSGYASTPSSIQHIASEGNRFGWPGKRSSPFPSGHRNATKRLRPATDHLGFSLVENLKQAHEDSGSETLLSAEVAEGGVSTQRLDAIMAKVRRLSDATAQASSTRDRSPFRQGSPLAPSMNSRRPVPRTRQQWGAGSQARSLLQHSSQGQRTLKTISPKMMGLSFHENDGPSSHLPPHQPGLPSDGASYPFTEQDPIELSGHFEPHQQREAKNSNIDQSPTDFMRTWPQQSEADKRARTSISLQSQIFQAQFGGAVDTASGDSQKPRISSAIEAFDDDYSNAHDATSAATQPVADERSQTKSDNQLNSNQDLDLLWQGAHSRSTMSQQEAFDISTRQRPSQFPSDPSIHAQRVAAIIQSIGRPKSNPTSPGELLLSPPGGQENRLICPICLRPVKTRSELKKHELRHTKPFRCEVPGCSTGFSTANDLARHTKSRHADAMANQSTVEKRFNCNVPGCKSGTKLWPRLDNFLSHLKRVHQVNSMDRDVDDIIRSAQYGITASENAEYNTPKPKVSAPPGEKAEDLDLQSLHVLADSAVLGDLFNQWPQSKEQKV